MNVISIDPSLRNTAFVGVRINPFDPTNFTINFTHLERTQKASKGLVRDDDWRCARVIAEAVQKLTEGAHAVIIEQPVGSQSARGSWAGGITLGAMASIHCPIFRLTPLEVKEGFTGNRYATKAEMIAKACKIFPEVELPKSRQKGKLKINAGKAEHICDALAVLYVGARTQEFQNFCREWKK